MSLKSYSQDLWDVLVVGGGPAGLSAALLLGRCLRTVLVCDHGRPRNRQSHLLNGFLSQDGLSPQAFLHTAREQLEQYETVSLRQSAVVAIERRENHFVAVMDSGDQVRAKTVLLASGLVDELPEVEGIGPLYGIAVHSCPFCHGWECRGQRIAVLGDSDETAELALELVSWSTHIVLCTQGRSAYAAEMQARLQARNIRLETKMVLRVESAAEGQQLSGLRLEDGSLLGCDAVFVSPRQRQHSDFARSLGCRLRGDDGCIDCGDDSQTNVPGVFTAGNASKGIQLAIMAAAEGARAAVAIQEALAEAELQQLVGKTTGRPGCQEA